MVGNQFADADFGDDYEEAADGSAADDPAG
jgi:hypothetical protein